MTGNEHYFEAERLLMVGAANPLDLWAALTHAVLALVATEEHSTDEIHRMAETLAQAAEANGETNGDNHEPYPGGLV